MGGCERWGSWKFRGDLNWQGFQRAESEALWNTIAWAMKCHCKNDFVAQKVTDWTSRVSGALFSTGHLATALSRNPNQCYFWLLWRRRQPPFCHSVFLSFSWLSDPFEPGPPLSHHQWQNHHTSCRSGEHTFPAGPDLHPWPRAPRIFLLLGVTDRTAFQEIHLFLYPQ